MPVHLSVGRFLLKQIIRNLFRNYKRKVKFDFRLCPLILSEKYLFTLVRSRGLCVLFFHILLMNDIEKSSSCMFEWWTWGCVKKLFHLFIFSQKVTYINLSFCIWKEISGSILREFSPFANKQYNFNKPEVAGKQSRNIYYISKNGQIWY